jgi:hypothetical protein
VQYLLRAVEQAPSLTALVLATWQVARVLAMHLIETVLAERARQPPTWPPCPACGTTLRSKGMARRHMMSVCGPLQRTGQRVTRLVQRRLVAVVGDIDALKPRLWLEALRQGIRSAPQVVWLSDGGRGLWRLFEAQSAVYATGVLDLYHAAQHLWKSAAAWCDGRTTQVRRWFGWARQRLRHGKPDGVWADLVEA